jgi:hypothetical protein
MSKQLAIASAFSVFALSALALLATGDRSSEPLYDAGAAIEIAAPAMVTSLLAD